MSGNGNRGFNQGNDMSGNSNGRYNQGNNMSGNSNGGFNNNNQQNNQNGKQRNRNGLFDMNFFSTSNNNPSSFPQRAERIKTGNYMLCQVG